MRVVVERCWETSVSVCGQLLVDSQHECFTLEPSREKPYHPGHPCIPAGEYKLILTPSPKFKMVTPELVEVAGRSDIRLHIGNFPKDSLGCILVGNTHSPNFVGNSAAAFRALMTLLKTATEEITIEIIDPK